MNLFSPSSFDLIRWFPGTDSGVVSARKSIGDPAQLLTALIVLYWCGGVTQQAAAKMVGIRRQEFVELAELRLGIHAFEDMAMRRFMAAFNELFPECDRRTSYRKDCGFRHDDGARQYTDAGLLRVPNRD